QIARPKEHERNTFLADYIKVLVKINSYREDISGCEKDFSNFIRDLHSQFSPQAPLQIKKIANTIT
ncbi:hypothetical protein, partial [Methanoculleus sp. MH98A]|uniref:hypothetical protein n=1 Tax=Methanoculleus sp. MH98A TaxID=1495314 RepID=UPI001E612339